MMRILMAMQCLVMGGAEKFFVSLAQALSAQHEVHCYIPLHAGSHPAMSARLGSAVVHSIPWMTPQLYRWFYKSTLLIQRRAPSFDPERGLHMRRLQSLHRQYRYDVVNAQLMPGARQVCQAFEHSSLPITKSDHGDTATFDPREDAIVLRRLNALVCPAEANAQRAATLPLQPACRVVTIPYGYAAPAEVKPVLPAFSGITLGMVARGVEQKGWREALATARILRQQQALRLVFVGAGPCLDGIRSELCEEDRRWVILAGEQAAPEAWIQSFDVALLPTYLREESLPNSIIEYLACGKPVVATDVGGIRSMVQSAGVVLPLGVTGRAEVPALVDAIRSVIAERSRFERAVPAAFASYEMKGCVMSYEALFASLVQT
jgi:glycosyltransferase involved in cell wall biosynthesis